MDNYFYKNLKYLRETHKMSQQYIADKIGVDRSSIGYWEGKKAEPVMINVIKIAELFNIDLKDLILKDLEDNTSSITYDNKKLEQQLLKDVLKRKGFLDENEELTEENYNRLIEFAKANKQFIMKDNEEK